MLLILLFVFDLPEVLDSQLVHLAAHHTVNQVLEKLIFLQDL